MIIQLCMCWCYCIITVCKSTAFLLRSEKSLQIVLYFVSHIFMCSSGQVIVLKVRRSGARFPMLVMYRSVRQTSHSILSLFTQQWWVPGGTKIVELWMLLAAENALNFLQREFQYQECKLWSLLNSLGYQTIDTYIYILLGSYKYHCKFILPLSMPLMHCCTVMLQLFQAAGRRPFKFAAAVQLVILTSKVHWPHQKAKMAAPTERVR